MSTQKASISGSQIPRLKRRSDLVGELVRDFGSTQGSFFQSSKNVDISGTQFTSARDIITINHHHSAKVYHEQGSIGGGQTAGSPVSGHNSPSSSSLSTQTGLEIYTRHLALKGRGYPLWIPESNNNLPVEYQMSGIRIGDVGIITPYGAFDFLFNVYLPQADPINPEQMPGDFAPLTPSPTPRDVRHYRPFKLDTHLASVNVKAATQRNTASFESSASEGAILTMPYGSNAEELRNVISLKKYASANAVKWYKYLITVCGHEAANGDLHLVVGHSKTTTWGMATFQNGSGQEKKTLLKFKTAGENRFGLEYGWEYSGTAEVKSGPDLKDMERLRHLVYASAECHDLAHENQCLFVQSINISLQENVWNRLVAEVEVNDGLFNDDSETDQESRGPGSSQRSESESIQVHNLTTGRGASGGTMDNTPVGSTNAQKEPESIQFSRSPQPPNVHPSRKINELLLKNNSNAMIALTEDKDWMTVIEKDDSVLPPAEALYSRIIAQHLIREEEGSVLIHRRDEASGLQVPVVQSRSLNHRHSLEFMPTNGASGWGMQSHNDSKDEGNPTTGMHSNPTRVRGTPSKFHFQNPNVFF